MMKKRCALALCITLGASCLCGYVAPEDRQYVDYFLRVQAAELFRKKSFVLNWSCAYVNLNRLQNVDLCFSAYRTLSKKQARELLVTIAEEIVARINSDPSIKERNLLKEPFTVNQIYLKIDTENVFSSQADPETIRVMCLDKGIITYTTYPASVLYYGRDCTSTETFEFARMLVGENVSFNDKGAIVRETAKAITEAPKSQPQAVVVSKSSEGLLTQQENSGPEKAQVDSGNALLLNNKPAFSSIVVSAEPFPTAPEAPSRTSASVEWTDQTQVPAVIPTPSQAPVQKPFAQPVQEEQPTIQNNTKPQLPAVLLPPSLPPQPEETQAPDEDLSPLPQETPVSFEVTPTNSTPSDKALLSMDSSGPGSAVEIPVEEHSSFFSWITDKLSFSKSEETPVALDQIPETIDLNDSSLVAMAPPSPEETIVTPSEERSSVFSWITEKLPFSSSEESLTAPETTSESRSPSDNSLLPMIVEKCSFGSKEPPKTESEGPSFFSSIAEKFSFSNSEEPSAALEPTEESGTSWFSSIAEKCSFGRDEPSQPESEGPSFFSSIAEKFNFSNSEEPSATLEPTEESGTSWFASIAEKCSFGRDEPSQPESEGPSFFSSIAEKFSFSNSEEPSAALEPTEESGTSFFSSITEKFNFSSTEQTPIAEAERQENSNKSSWLAWGSNEPTQPEHKETAHLITEEPVVAQAENTTSIGQKWLGWTGLYATASQEEKLEEKQEPSDDETLAWVEQFGHWARERPTTATTGTSSLPLVAAASDSSTQIASELGEVTRPDEVWRDEDQDDADADDDLDEDVQSSSNSSWLSMISSMWSKKEV